MELDFESTESVKAEYRGMLIYAKAHVTSTSVLSDCVAISLLLASMTSDTPTSQNGGIRLGALGWSNPAWLDFFYPADMPEEWRLTYFNTQFGCVFLDAVTWQQASSEQRTQWNTDTHQEFVFLLEDDSLSPPPLELAGKALTLRSDDARLVWFTRDTSLKDLAAVLSTHVDLTPRFLISQDGDLGQLDRVATLLEVMGM